MKKNAFTGRTTVYNQEHGVSGEGTLFNEACWVWNFRIPLAQALGTDVDILIMAFFSGIATTNYFRNYVVFARYKCNFPHTTHCVDPNMKIK